ncbi:MAG TPA: sigma-70 family RNA polymerase sigma factor [Gemmataceae bacterium]|nr:sigma-70 family RNA polymerase sigma factor [Gemmataceae bacterium]
MPASVPITSVHLPPAPTSALRRAIEQDYRALERGIRLLVFRTTGPLRDHEIDGIVQETINETWIRAVRNEHRYDSSRPALPWLLAIATNVLLERRRANFRDGRQQSETDLSAGDELLENMLSGSDTQADTNSDRLAVRAILAKLPAETRSLLEARFMQGLDGPDLAERLGISHGAARVRLCRALQQFRKLWLASRGNSHD